MKQRPATKKKTKKQRRLENERSGHKYWYLFMSGLLAKKEKYKKIKCITLKNLIDTLDRRP